MLTVDADGAVVVHGAAFINAERHLKRHLKTLAGDIKHQTAVKRRRIMISLAFDNIQLHHYLSLPQYIIAQLSVCCQAAQFVLQSAFCVMVNLSDN